MLLNNSNQSPRRRMQMNVEGAVPKFRLFSGVRRPPQLALPPLKIRLRA
jgi:hypothetical protein